MFPEEFDPGHGPAKTEPAAPGRPMFDKPDGSRARGVQSGDKPDPGFTVVNRGTDTNPEAVPLRATQDHVYADDVNHQMGEMLSKGKDYDWGVGTPGGIKVDPNGKILDGHHLGRPRGAIRRIKKVSGFVKADGISLRRTIHSDAVVTWEDSTARRPPNTDPSRRESRQSPRSWLTVAKLSLLLQN